MRLMDALRQPVLSKSLNNHIENTYKTEELEENQQKTKFSTDLKMYKQNLKPQLTNTARPLSSESNFSKNK